MTDQPSNKLSEKMDALVPFEGEQMEQFRRTIARLRGMISNGRKLRDDQVVALAQYATVEQLDPLTGECYLMTDKDGNTMAIVAGVAGARRKAREALRGGDFFLEFIELKDLPPGVEIGYRVILRDTESQANYIKRLGEAARLYKEIGLPPADAIAMARQDIGNSPTWEAEGYFHASERSDYKDAKYNPREKARKRAEAAVLRKRFGLHFSVGDNGDSGAVEVVEGSWAEAPAQDADPQPQRTEAQIMMELGY